MAGGALILRQMLTSGKLFLLNEHQQEAVLFPQYRFVLLFSIGITFANPAANRNQVPGVSRKSTKLCRLLWEARKHLQNTHG